MFLYTFNLSHLISYHPSHVIFYHCIFYLLLASWGLIPKCSTAFFISTQPLLFCLIRRSISYIFVFDLARYDFPYSWLLHSILVSWILGIGYLFSVFVIKIKGGWGRLWAERMGMTKRWFFVVRCVYVWRCYMVGAKNDRCMWHLSRILFASPVLSIFLSLFACDTLRDSICKNAVIYVVATHKCRSLNR